MPHTQKSFFSVMVNSGSLVCRIIVFFLLQLPITNPASGNPRKTIGIFTYKVQGLQPWDPDSIKSGLNGSEEAVVYMSQQLAKLGYKVTVFAIPPESSPYTVESANPRFVTSDFNDGSLLDIAISWRLPDAAERLKKRASKVYLWPHDTYHSILNLEQINGFDEVLWISKWQREQWISVNPGFTRFTTVFGNGINPEQFRPVQKRINPCSCIYGSNYARGLEILLDIWPVIRERFPKATLDIYYGWQHWGLLTPVKEAKMRKQISELALLGVVDHGQVGHEELNRAYEKASFWTYPCLAPETFCISGLRAQLAGAVPVIIEGSALKETVRYGFKCLKAEEYLETLTKALQSAEQITLEERRNMGDFILKEYTWEVIARKWKELFDSNSTLERNAESYFNHLKKPDMDNLD